MKKVLIAEDDYYIQEIFLIAFRKAEYNVILAKDGEEAVEKAKVDVYDVILLDIMMPKMNGIEVLRILRAPGSLAQKTPVFLLTNLAQDNIIKEAFDIGADGYFIKAQMDPDDVIEELEKYFQDNKQTKSDIKNF